MSIAAPAQSVSRARAIAAVSIGALFFAFAFLHRVAPSVMTGELMRDFAVGGAALGTLSAWYFYAYASIQLPVGMLNDRFGPRKLMSAAVAVCALGSFGFALADTVLAASFFRAIIGASVAFAFLGALTIAGYWFPPSRFAMLAGAIQAMGMLGAMLGQAPLRHAVEVFGWRATVGAMGAFAIALAAALFIIVPRRPRHQTRDGTAPEAHNTWTGVVAVVANPQSWACAGIGFGMTAIMLAFAGLWAVPWLTSVHGYAPAAAAGVVSMLFFGWALAAPAMGWLSDHIGRRKPVLLVGILCNTAIFMTILLAAPALAAVPLLLSALLFALGVSGSMMTIAFGSMREVNAAHHSATAMGLVNMCVVGSGAVMQPLIGWLLDLGWDGRIVDGARVYASGDYTTAFSVLIASNLLALACVMRLRETYCRPLSEQD